MRSRKEVEGITNTLYAYCFTEETSSMPGAENALSKPLFEGIGQVDDRC